MFANPEWLELGFAIVATHLREHAVTRLKIANHPPTHAIVNLLERNPPSDVTAARTWFEILSGRMAGEVVTVLLDKPLTQSIDFQPNELRKLSAVPFVPTKPASEKGPIKHLPPNQCYLSGVSSKDFHSKLFVFVDFGDRANNFLKACGSKPEPSVEEITQILLNDPRRFYELSGGRERQVLL